MLSGCVIERFFKWLVMQSGIRYFTSRTMVLSEAQGPKRKFFPIGRMLKMMTRTWLVLGIVAVLYALALVGCGSVVDRYPAH